MPAISRRASDLGTENAFVVLAEVSALQRQGKDIISFCIGQPDFHTPKTSATRHQGDQRGQARLHAFGRDSGIARSGANYLNRTRRIKVSADDIVVGAGQSRSLPIRFSRSATMARATR
jgi:aspartate/methionine/tyrosine aminotransferase